jgi:putative ABC transport system ATP-binding protein
VICSSVIPSNCPAANSNASPSAAPSRPALLLADEPTGNLDEATSDDVLQLLLDLLADSPTSLLMVTHSPRVAARLSRQATLHLGRLAAEGVR